jgi:hypothetical protein
MSTTAEALLNIMSVRLSMQEAGTIKPHPSGVLATRQLVEKLSVLAPNESVEISYTLEPFNVRYVRIQTGEVLAEILERENT